MDNGISGYIRCCNEAEFIVPSIMSHLPYVDELVVALQPSTDGTEEIVLDLAEKYDKIKVFEYPVKPYFVDTKEFHELPDDSIYSFVHLSNWGLSKCRYKWISKSEGDVVALSSFRNIIDQISINPDHKCYYGRVLLNIAGENCDKISLSNPRNAGWDVAVFPNSPEYHFIKAEKWETVTMPLPRVCMGWSGLHLKRCKRKNANQAGDWIKWNRENVREALRLYNEKHEYVGVDNPLGEEVLYEETMVTKAR